MNSADDSVRDDETSPNPEDHHDEPIVVDNRPFHLDMGIRHNVNGNTKKNNRLSSPFQALVLMTVDLGGNVATHGPFALQQSEVTIELGDESAVHRNTLKFTHATDDEGDERAFVELTTVSGNDTFAVEKGRLKVKGRDRRVRAVSSPGVGNIPPLLDNQGKYRFGKVMVIIVPKPEP